MGEFLDDLLAPGVPPRDARDPESVIADALGELPPPGALPGDELVPDYLGDGFPRWIRKGPGGIVMWSAPVEGP